MKLNLFKTLWGHTQAFEVACTETKKAGFQGIEGQAPKSSGEQNQWRSLLNDFDLQYIAEIVTGGGYVPRPGLNPQQHLDDLKRGLDASMALSPQFATTLCGSDRWEFKNLIPFYEAVLHLADEYGTTISIETHRSRPTFNPWQTARIIDALPDLILTCDFSHWCVVTERLVMNEEPDLLKKFAQSCHHIHGRVGYDQGPQVPDPRAPEYATELQAHLHWWNVLKDTMKAQERTHFTMTPEFGPDGYLQTTPFTQEPAGDLWEINQWMGQYLRESLG